MRLRRKKEQAPTYSGLCFVNCIDQDGYSTVRWKCRAPTYGGRCPQHGDVTYHLLNARWPTVKTPYPKEK